MRSRHDGTLGSRSFRGSHAWKSAHGDDSPVGPSWDDTKACRTRGTATLLERVSDTEGHEATHGVTVSNDVAPSTKAFLGYHNAAVAVPDPPPAG